MKHPDSRVHGRKEYLERDGDWSWRRYSFQRNGCTPRQGKCKLDPQRFRNVSFSVHNVLFTGIMGKQRRDTMWIRKM